MSLLVVHGIGVSCGVFYDVAHGFIHEKCLFVAQGVICALQWLWCYVGVTHKVFLSVASTLLGCVCRCSNIA
jgi:hypothetical protein